MGEPNWYVARNGQRVGPHTQAQLKDLAAGGRLRPADMVWQEGAAAWTAAGTIPGLFEPRRRTRGGRTVCEACGSQAEETAFACPRCGAVPRPMADELERTRKVYAFILGWCVPFLILIGTYSYVRDASNRFVAVLVVLGLLATAVLAAGQLIGWRHLWRAWFGR